MDAAGRLPILVYGDGPRLPSGLGRIARDLTNRLVNESDRLGITVGQVGVDPPDGWHHQAWPFFGFQPTFGDQGREAVGSALEECGGGSLTPVVFMVMDPSRCFDLTREDTTVPAGRLRTLPAHFWGYFPIDSENVQGAISGPAAEAVWSCQRVLAYGRYGAGVLKRTLDQQLEEKLTARRGAGTQYYTGAVSYLPHGLDDHFRPTPLTDDADQFRQWYQALPAGAWVIGCVATNQPRKDFSMLFSAASLLKREGASVGLWLHTDRLTNAWDVGQLCHDFGFVASEVCVSTGDTLLSDPALAARYTISDATLAIGLGEGFGYPIVESLACGTPVVHGRFGGGTELVPRADWLIDPVALRLESCYAVKRPVFAPVEIARHLHAAMAWKRAHPALCQAYCQGAVAHLRWETLWPRWRRWFQHGIDQARRQRQGAPWDTKAGTTITR